MKRRSTALARTTVSGCHRHLQSKLRSLSNSSRLSSASAASPSSPERPSLPRLNLDASTSSLLHDLHLGTGSSHADKSQIGDVAGRRRYRRPLVLDEKDLAAMNEARRVDGQDELVVTEAGDLRSSDGGNSDTRTANSTDSDAAIHGSSNRDSPDYEHDSESHGREERRSPAAVFASKRIGSVVLPEELLESIQRQIDGTDDKKLLRQAYLSKQTAKSTVTGSPQHLSTSLQTHLHHEKDDSSPSSRRKTAVTPLSALVSAAVDLPTEYAVVRNVVREVEKRIGTEEWRRLGLGARIGEEGGEEIEGRRGLIVWDSGVGSALWAVSDSYALLPSNASQSATTESTKMSLPVDYIQGSRHMLEMTRSLFDEIAQDADVRYQRVDKQLGTPNVAISTFQISKLPTKKARLNRIQEVWDTGAEVMIVIDHGHKDGYQAVMEARDQLLTLGRSTPAALATAESTPIGALMVEDEQTGEVRPISKKERQRLKKDARKAKKETQSKGAHKPISRSESGQEVVQIGKEIFYEDQGSGMLGVDASGEPKVDMVGSHVIAPCPHDGTCPLASTRDICHFSQRLQTPAFFRKTKHSTQGDADLKYSYVVIRRGPRPGKQPQDIGRMGAVAKEEIAAFERKSSSELQRLIVPVVGGKEGDYEVLAVGDEAEEAATSRKWPDDSLSKEEVQDALRGQAYQWPRLVYPPMKRSGHVVMDTCHPSGSIVRLTVAKSDTKQVYHDARKSSWGDLFPHRPRATERVRTRGIKKLNKVTPLDDDYTTGIDDALEDVSMKDVLRAIDGSEQPVDGADLLTENKILEEYIRELPTAEYVDIDEPTAASSASQSTSHVASNVASS